MPKGSDDSLTKEALIRILDVLERHDELFSVEDFLDLDEARKYAERIDRLRGAAREPEETK